MIEYNGRISKPIKNSLTSDYFKSSPKSKIVHFLGRMIVAATVSKVVLSTLKNSVYLIQVENLKPTKIIKA
jgi:hypothetical protein